MIRRRDEEQYDNSKAVIYNSVDNEQLQSHLLSVIDGLMTETLID